MSQSFETMKSAELVAAYNNAAAILGAKPVTKFSDRKAAIKRVTEIVAKLPAPKAKKAAKPAGEKKVTVAGRIKGLVADGLTNQEIWAIVQPEFDLPDSKKNYPAWYRRDLNKRA